MPSKYPYSISANLGLPHTKVLATEDNIKNNETTSAIYDITLLFFLYIGAPLYCWGRDAGKTLQLSGYSLL